MWVQILHAEGQFWAGWVAAHCQVYELHSVSCAKPPELIGMLFRLWARVSPRKRKGKEEYLYSAFLHQGTHKVLRHGSHSFTCKQHHPCLSFVSVHQMSPPQQLRQQTSNCSSLLIYQPRKDERLSWPSWLTYSRWLTHISGHPSATSRAQDSESTSAKD